MTEEEARQWLQSRFDVSRGTWERLESYVAILLREMEQQNLIAESTRAHIWARHIVDSAQLLPLAAKAGQGRWVDLGSGAGLPAIVIAILHERPIQLVESRRKRIDFLNDVIAELGLSHAQVFGGRVETVPASAAAIISARAYAPLPRLLESAHHLADEKTIWVLPKGRNAQNELEAATRSWQGAFHVERSVTDADSAIIVAEAVRSVRRKARG
ncbi:MULTISPECIES: 16S rRNA (guanine(527)-N(7))-methyltransferase RsmG [Sphingobium]|uniref:Ribosomal RNA small subunit methyltransferase G n=2 Tax=Sphingobium fuliginis (strain ATCC 27551) TaxID=336203 RepID=A0ABQ1F9L4_SPHSA|nr:MULTISPECIES: 16S rRNA (guanine(527)-N(7))-methyltransferase RsmG [Sphingobium]OAP30775.1 16S rRNA (guanine(527)-N(7))-methyltransferase RsmG [Sphingobium sp. 20006FA]AJR23175.1 16S rRNA methyltransferase [Sphingobium sp. YBL2]KXU33205.1 16S rRNA (guanine(527)-N(7))-methyltransferase RsmG [Sphingobium sp. AM]KYC31532.1 16S rRNA (guanine(527)-N(7))-methyltransferase RsmG [Sphingobium sp. 22B]QDC38492.1 16S rRNA (guanine(527)-N(7))-methyltransferase RsmG [Sphingobium fuliginis ATCC 27551]